MTIYAKKYHKVACLRKYSREELFKEQAQPSVYKSKIKRPKTIVAVIIWMDFFTYNLGNSCGTIFINKFIQFSVIK
jgi:hypothetical protein